MQRGCFKISDMLANESWNINVDVLGLMLFWQVPPTGKGSLYIRPLLIGTGPILGLAPAPEYTFLVYVSPVGTYFKVSELQITFGLYVFSFSVKMSCSFSSSCVFLYLFSFFLSFLFFLFLFLLFGNGGFQLINIHAAHAFVAGRAISYWPESGNLFPSCCSWWDWGS